MRRIAALGALALLFVVPSTASAVTDTAAFRARMNMASLPAKNAPAPLAYSWIQEINTSPGEQQPDTGSSFTFSFAREIESNAVYFPTCTSAELDGNDAVPLACQAAIVGSGLAVAYGGAPGAPLANGVREDMSVTLFNGTPAGEQWLIYLRSLPNQPVYIRRVVPGTVVRANNPYGFAVRFEIPPDLQFSNGLTITVTKLVVNIPSDLHVVDVKGTLYDASFLRITSCDTSVPAADHIEFSASGAYPLGALDLSTTVPCEVGPGGASYPAYPGYPPGYPAYPPGNSPYPLLPAHGNGSGGGKGGGKGNGPPPRIAGRARTRTVTVDRRGWFMLAGVTVACPSASRGACSVVAKAARASVRFKLRKGRSSAVKLRLRKAARRLLVRSRKLHLVVRVTAREAGGAETTRKFEATVRARPR